MCVIKQLQSGLDSVIGLREWVESRFDRSLLVLGDATSPLVAYATFWLATDKNSDAIEGVMVVFEGFSNPVVSIVAENERIAQHLLAKVDYNKAPILSVALNQRFTDDAWVVMDNDLWLALDCHKQPTPTVNVHRLIDAEEIASFLRKQEIHFWHPAMHEFGYAYGIRNDAGDLVSYAGVNFIVSTPSYAQLGPLITAPEYRGRGYASALIRMLVNALSESGVQSCGLFADVHNLPLQNLYRKLGFSPRGRFNFYTHKSL